MGPDRELGHRVALRHRHPRVTEDEIREHLAAGRCPFCGRADLKVLAQHTQKIHGVDKRELRRMAGLSLRAPLVPPELSERLAELAIERNQIGRVQAAPRGDTSGVSDAGRRGRGVSADISAADRRKIPVEDLDVILKRRAHGETLRAIAADYRASASALCLFLQSRPGQRDALDDVRLLSEAKAEVEEQLVDLTERWKASVKAARADGVTRTAIGEAAGISRQRVTQIEENRWR